MQTLELKFLERLAIADLLGSQRGDLKTLETYRRAYRQVRFTEAETKELGLRIVNLTPQQARWAWKDGADLPKFGVSINLEDNDAKALAAVLQNHPGWGMDDLDWVEPLIALLTKERSDGPGNTN